MYVIEPRDFLVSLFHAAVAAADADKVIRTHLPEKPKGRTIVVGAGKGAAHLARALEQAWGEPLEGTIVTRYGFGVPCENIEVLEASHPVPDAAGLVAADRLLDVVSGLSEDDLVIALICGGGSALLPAPAEGLDLSEEMTLNRMLLASGAPISAMNTIRKQVSRIKGGRLAAAAWPARVVSLIVSDIPGDNAADVASGPTLPDSGGAQEALAAIRRYGIKLPDKLLRHIEHGDSIPPVPLDARFSRNAHSIRLHFSRSGRICRQSRWNSSRLSDAIEGEAREAAHVHAVIAREVLLRDRPFTKPVVLLSGGETTVTIKGAGRGGRNTEFLLSLAMGIDGHAMVHALAADTDGIDGSEDNAGAFADGTTVMRLQACGLDPSTVLANNDAWTAFDRIGDLFVPGPTGTNVNDFRAILVV